jgi:hypothetical protein
MATFYLMGCQSGASPVSTIGASQGNRTSPYCAPFIGEEGTPYAVDPVVFQAWPVPVFQSSDIDPTVVVSMYSAGFMLFLVPFAAAWGVAQMLKLLR